MLSSYNILNTFKINLKIMINVRKMSVNSYNITIHHIVI